MASRPLHGSPQPTGHSYHSLSEAGRSRRPASLTGSSGPASHQQMGNPLLHHQHQRMQPGSRHSLSGPSVPSPPVPVTSSHSKHPPSVREQRFSVGGIGHGVPTVSQSYHAQQQPPQQPGAWSMPKMRHIGGPASQSTPAEQTKKSKGRKRNRGNTTDTDRPCQEHSFITDVNDIQTMQDGLLKLMRDFETGKLSAFDEHCSFEKMNNVRDLQEKLGRMHFKMEADIQNAGANTKEGIDIATQNMDHLLSNLDQLSMAIRSLHPPGDSTAFHPEPPV
ncbi:coiled-coil domain-containing protein 28B-like [Acanthaster planci]|uniref:Coiled-coil domain-containing protein 28B-like n=1 Tax=Acanthaster planci TaxID=133434 RepID=A0A8B7Z692_ACAPL|nr:coiled-coil domain-containing protein 28B-like [Acanthaster planci]XP_022100468.1 coiled-coil domain-containing protein 28B-like [Acanthaster planci]